MKVCIIWDYDYDLGPDPNDKLKDPRRIGEFIDSDKQDVIVAWRDSHRRTQICASGIFDTETIKAVLP